MNAFPSRFTISNAIAAGLTGIERARGFLEAATLSDDWVRPMSQRALLLEARHITQSRAPTLALAPMSMHRHLLCIAEGHETQ
ncbi:MAG: hypothetical protein A2X51_11220 [Candidatus Rokubacteria bacterium GWC2_70_24]|nr:MAG: hypothetical protein A2X53_15845 [Candidatus Rokubacteria bacterium GWA2_70_23]OGK86007.1 MAG: hypothetical protein A2X51_11220 [Candidatus Rokubacteria bacterium GWC2_70_24]OGL18122.1 MAG: hypothetical protein A3K12_08650 [Candidatus Rokubacteria bacterium RIFCSPLOWO2_12_FULL_71_19]HAM40409.1 hypothetical protein [Candidatus Omnitrophota bacterium]